MVTFKMSIDVHRHRSISKVTCTFHHNTYFQVNYPNNLKSLISNISHFGSVRYLESASEILEIKRFKVIELIDPEVTDVAISHKINRFGEHLRKRKS